MKEPTSYFVKRHALVNRILDVLVDQGSYENLYDAVCSDWVTHKLFDDALEILIGYKQITVSHYEGLGWMVYRVQTENST